MKLLRCEVTNFGSYEHFRIDFNQQGLTLVEGPTGSGKSTIMDMPAWILFGVTSKDGNVDEVKNWSKPDELTTGEQVVEVNGTTLSVLRTRGKGNKNDLSWRENEGETLRGKDLVDTQRLLNLRLGCDSFLYLLSCYYSEFSSSSHFFLANAKDRKALFEKVADLELAVRVAERAAEKKKELKINAKPQELQLATLAGTLSEKRSAAAKLNVAFTEWGNKQAATIKELQEKLVNYDQRQKERAMFESKRQQEHTLMLREKITSLSENIKDLDNCIKPTSFYEGTIALLQEKISHLKNNRCEHCGGVVENKQSDSMQEELTKTGAARFNNLQLISQRHHYAENLADLLDEEKTSGEENKVITIERSLYQSQLNSESNRPNPLSDQFLKIDAEITECAYRQRALECELASLTRQISSLELLSEISLELRAHLLKKTVFRIKNEMNNYLSSYFDSEISVRFYIKNNDALDVEIQKNGHDCGFRQLSKGQRQLLKLCFSVVIMNIAAEKSGNKFTTLFLDEPTDGLDPELKLKSFRLFQDLNKRHESVIVIEHNTEFNSMFDNKLSVRLVNDFSEVSSAR